MTTRRTSAPRKRPAPSSMAPKALHVEAPRKDAEGAEASVDGARFDAEQRGQIIADFEAALREQGGMEKDELEFALHHFIEAIDNAPLGGKLGAPDVDAWKQTLNAMVDEGALTEQDRNDLAHQFEQAAAVFQDEDLQIAIEFAERMARDGEEQALVWLNSRRAGGGSGEGIEPRKSSETTQPSLKQAITKSKSRRLRGPPHR